MVKAVRKSTSKLKQRIKKDNLYIIAAVLIIFWAIGFFVFSVGISIHLLLAFAAVSIMVRIASGNKAMKR